MTTPQRVALRLGAGWWLGYLSVLAPIVTYAGFRFAALYSADSFTTEPALSQQYHSFVALSGIALAICLGIAAAAYGAWLSSVVHGVLALGLGSGTTVVALTVVPPVRFAEDQYAPAALWIIADGAPLVVAFVIATLAGWLLRAGKDVETRTRS